MSAQIKLNKQIAHEAARWAEQIDDGLISESDRHAFAEWIMRSPEHVSEFLLAMTIFTAWGEATQNNQTSIEQLLSDTVPDVIPLLNNREPRKATEKKRAFSSNIFKPALAAAIIAGAAIVLGTVLFNRTFDEGNQDITQLYTTIVGEQRSVPLADGSVMHLNTHSQARIHFSGNKREIDLLSGEALFQVTHDPERPFLVKSGPAIAEVLGTKFNVYHLQDQTTISVVEGKVGVSPVKSTDNSTYEQSTSKTATPESRIILAVGEQADVKQNGLMTKSQIANLGAVTSWRLRQLVFQREPLSTIVREYNRYNRVRIYIDSAELSNTRISGVFMADDPESLLSSLELSGDIQIDRSQRGEIRLKNSAD